MSILDTNFRLTGMARKARPAAVAGMFYPDDPEELRGLIDEFLDQSETTSPVPKGIIVPHAGYIYSGVVAAKAYASIKPAHETIKRVVLLGPAHRVYVRGMALSSATEFSTPLGTIPIDLTLSKELDKLPYVQTLDSAHAQEHSLEVQLPFLQSTLDDFSLLPIVVGEASPQEVKEVLQLLWGKEDTLIVISSDLSHYHDYETASEIDASTSEAIKHMDLENIGPNQACGCVPMSGLLEIARQTGMQIQQLDLKNSGDTAGPRDRVVGYGAYAVYQTRIYTHQQETQLLEITSQSILNGLKHSKPLKPDIQNFDPSLQEIRACFVTLKIKGELRGCIGTTEAISPLVISVADNAFRAAFHDPRFGPLTEKEFQQVDMSISVLSPPESMEFSSEQDLCSQLRPGVDGLIIEKGTSRATFLPEVWESLDSPTDFLTHLKNKAGISQADSPNRAWRYGSVHITTVNL